MRYLTAWRSLPGGWRAASVVALLWLPVGAVIILATSAAGNPLPDALRIARALVTLVAWGVIATTAAKVVRAAR